MKKLFPFLLVILVSFSFGNECNKQLAKVVVKSTMPKKIKLVKSDGSYEREDNDENFIRKAIDKSLHINKSLTFFEFDKQYLNHILLHSFNPNYQCDSIDFLPKLDILTYNKQFNILLKKLYIFKSNLELDTRTNHNFISQYFYEPNN